MDLNQILNDLINDGTIQPIIVVTPSCYNYFYGSWYANSSVNGNWEDFIVQDVVHYADSHYRTLTSAESRGIAGHSMGGGGAMKIAIKHPDVFGVVYCHTTRYLVFEQMLNWQKEYMIQAYEIDDWKSSFSTFNIDLLDLMITASNPSAFAPNETDTPLFGCFPLTESGELRDSIWQLWLEHDPYIILLNKIENAKQLNAVGLDVGDEELHVSSTSLFCSILDQHEIYNQLEIYEGGHSNKTAERLERTILPFLSDHLVHEED
jgi:hypothetical protein